MLQTIEKKRMSYYICDVKDRHNGRKTEQKNIAPVIFLYTETKRHNSNYTTYYKKIPVNCFLHSKITLLEHGSYGRFS